MVTVETPKSTLSASTRTSSVLRASSTICSLRLSELLPCSCIDSFDSKVFYFVSKVSLHAKAASSAPRVFTRDCLAWKVYRLAALRGTTTGRCSCDVQAR